MQRSSVALTCILVVGTISCGNIREIDDHSYSSASMNDIIEVQPNQIRINGSGFIIKTQSPLSSVGASCYDAVPHSEEVDQELRNALRACTAGRWCVAGEGLSNISLSLRPYSDAVIGLPSYRAEAGEILISSSASYEYQEQINFFRCPGSSSTLNLYSIESLSVIHAD